MINTDKIYGIQLQIMTKNFKTISSQNKQFVF